MRINGLRILSLLLTLPFAGSALSEPSTFVVMQERVNPLLQRKYPLDAIRECANARTCRSLVESGTHPLGIPKNQLSAALASVPSAQRQGDVGFYSLALPSGYQYCRSVIQTVSVFPATGDQASYMTAMSTTNGVKISLSTPNLGPAQARSWVEANYIVYGVRNDVALAARTKGTCTFPGKTLASCRGAHGSNKGMPACRTMKD